MEVRTKESLKNSPKMTLKGYYEQLPDSNHPKTDFVNAVVAETGVSVQTVRNWVIYGMRPSKKSHVDILVRLTGIPENELWEER